MKTLDELAQKRDLPWGARISSCWKREDSPRAAGSAWTGQAPCRDFGNSLRPSIFRKRRWSGGGLMQERQVTGTGIRGSARGTQHPFPLALSRKDGRFGPVTLGTVKGWSIQKATDDERSRNVYENKRKLAKCPKMNATFCPTHCPFCKVRRLSPSLGTSGDFRFIHNGQTAGRRSEIDTKMSPGIAFKERWIERRAEWKTQ